MERKRLIETIRKNSLIEYGDKILIGMSGGPDSIFLYEILKKIQVDYNLTLGFAHINHNLRGIEGNSDENFVRNLSVSDNISCYVKSVDINNYAKLNKLGTEEAGRIVRYDFFQEIKEKEGYTKVALAHNKDDIVETFLFRLMRGTSLGGLEGIPIKRDFYIRPVIEFYKQEILGFLKMNNVLYCVDSTNLENIYTRNAIRLDLIPYIEERYNPKFKEKLTNLIEDISATNEILEKYFKQIIQKILREKVIDTKIFQDKTDYEIRYILKKYLDFFSIEVSREKLTEIKKIIGRSGNKEISLDKEHIIINTYGKMTITKRNKKITSKKEIVILSLPGKVKYNNFLIEAEIIDSSWTQGIVERNIDIHTTQHVFYVDIKEENHLLIRNRQEGDKIIPLGMKSLKKLKDIFINAKVPKEIRERLPILTTSKNEIIWVLGVKKSQTFKVIRESNRIVKLTFKEEGNNCGR